MNTGKLLKLIICFLLLLCSSGSKAQTIGSTTWTIMGGATTSDPKDTSAGRRNCIFLRQEVQSTLQLESDSIILESGVFPMQMVPVATITPKLRENHKTAPDNVDELEYRDTICQDDPAPLRAGGGAGYIWATNQSDFKDTSHPWDSSASYTGQIMPDSIAIFPKADSLIYVIAYNGNYRSIPDTVNIRVRRIPVTIKLGDITENPKDTSNGNNARIAVILSDFKYLDQCHPDSAVLRTTFNKMLFYPKEVINGRIVTQYMHLDSLVVESKFYVPPTPKIGDTVAYIAGSVLLGNSQSTSITPIKRKFDDSSSWYHKDQELNALWYRDGKEYFFVTTDIENGSVTLDSLCFSNGALRFTDRKLQVMYLAPNPASAQAQLSLYSYAGSPVSISFVDLFGRVVHTLDNLTIASGTEESMVYNVPLQGLPIGTYKVNVCNMYSCQMVSLVVVR